MPACICMNCGDIGQFRAKRGMALADQPCSKCRGKRSATRPYRVRFQYPGGMRSTWLFFTEAQARDEATRFGKDGKTILAIEQRTPTGWMGLS